MLALSTGARFSGVALFLAVSAALLAVGCGSGSSSTPNGTEDSGSRGGEVRVTWEEPETEEDELGYELLEASETEEVARALAESFELPNPLLVRGVNGHEGGPAYYEEDSSIVLPYGFAALAFEVGESVNPEGSSEEHGEQAGAINSFILAHEFAHALIANLELPVLGSEEDAADSIATAVLLEVPEGDVYAADAAAFWAEFSGRQEPPALVDYADTHSLDLQRAFDILCWVAGSSRASFEEVAELEAFPESRLETCPDEYEQLMTSLEKSLQPHLENGASLEP